VNTGLWHINLKQTNKHIPIPIANNVYELHNTGALVHYLHKALFSPTKAAMLQAVKDGHLITWPGLTEDPINKHLKLTRDTAMGHMNHRRQNISSTSKAPIEKQQPPDTDLGTNTHLVYVVVVGQGQLYTSLTGKFLVRSSKGNSYVMVCYIYDCNYIKVVPMNSRSASEWVKAFVAACVFSVALVCSVAMSLSGIKTVGSTALAKYKTDPVTFWIVRHCCAVSRGVSSFVAY
jgi:hypothetical protein